MRTMIHPSFTPGNLLGNARELCDAHQLANERMVPVKSFAITADQVEKNFKVGPGKYLTALWLFNRMAQAGHPTFELNDNDKRNMAGYFGRKLLFKAHEAPSDHPALHLLLGQTVKVELELSVDYRKHLAASRSPEEIINHAWDRRADITSASPEPFLRHALLWFFYTFNGHGLTINKSNNSWPTLEWAKRAIALNELIKRVGT